MSNVLKHMTSSVNLDKARFFCDSRNIFTAREKFTLKDNIQREDKKGLKIKKAARLSSYQGSNSWIMLSNRITAKSRLAKPPSHAKERMVKVSKDCQPIVCVFPSALLIFLSFGPDASLSSTSILESRATFLRLDQSAVTSCKVVPVSRGPRHEINGHVSHLLAIQC